MYTYRFRLKNKRPFFKVLHFTKPLHHEQYTEFFQDLISAFFFKYLNRDGPRGERKKYNWHSTQDINALEASFFYTRMLSALDTCSFHLTIILGKNFKNSDTSVIIMKFEKHSMIWRNTPSICRIVCINNLILLLNNNK